MAELEPLVTRAQAGEREAYCALVARLQDMAVGYAYGILADFQLAEDAAQEAFVDACLNLPKLREPSAFPAWLRRIVFKHCDRLTRGKRPAHVPLELAAEVAVDMGGPAEIAEREELRAAIRGMVADLPEGQRTAVSLYYIGDYSCSEIAAFLDVPVSTVKNRLHAARAALLDRALDEFRERLREHRPSETRLFAERIRTMLNIAPDRRDADAVLEVVGRQWPFVSGEINSGRITESHYDWATSRIGVVDGQTVTHFGVYEIAMRVGVARLRTAGVQLVTTLADHRGQGLMTDTARAALDAMRAGGYDLSVVCNADEDADGLYRKLGFVSAWPETSVSVAVEDLPPEPPGVEIREYVPGRRPELAPILAELHNRENEAVTGTAVRPTYLRTKMPDDGDAGWLWADERGRPLGYVHGARAEHPEPGTFWQVDSAGDPETRLRVLRSLASRSGCATVYFDRQPLRSPLGRRLRRLRCIQHTRHRPTGGWLIRVLNLHSAFEKIAPELSERLARSGTQWSGALMLSDGEESVALRIEGAHVEIAAWERSPHAVLGGPEIAQLLVGTRDPEATAEAEGTRLTGDAHRLVRVLFPAQDPQMCNEDLWGGGRVGRG